MGESAFQKKDSQDGTERDSAWESSGEQWWPGAESASSCNAWPWAPNGDTSHEERQWFVFDEVDVTPGWNADTFPYGKNMMSKEEAIDYAKEACKTNGHIGFVDVGQWKTIYYKKAEAENASPSFKYVNDGKEIKLYLWLAPDQHRKWREAEMESRRLAQQKKPEETAANGA